MAKRPGERSGRHRRLEPTSIEQVVETRREDEMAWRGTKKEERTPEKKGNLGPEEGQVKGGLEKGKSTRLAGRKQPEK